jgi:hypothetical protein
MALFGGFLKCVPIAASASGANVLVAAVSGKKLRVHGFSLSFSGTANGKFTSAASDITGLYYGLASTQVVVPNSELGYFETAAGEALGINLSAAIAVGGVVCYSEVG